MTLNPMKGARFGLALLGAAAWLAPAPAAQNGTSAQPLPTDPLSVNLRILADSPHNVGALIGAGKAALDLGDAQGALTFFARAEQEAPRDGWVKKWEGSALVQLEQPAAALKFFRDAVSLGVPETAVAGDRGLAWDITGDPRRAQGDYRLALSQGSDAEVTRRLALSLAITGEREQALRLLQDQLERRDRAAFRTRALVLALTGDWQDADRDVQAEMPAAQAAAIEPYLARLPTLSLADRALAVHLGHFPGNGRAAPPATSYAQNGYAQNGYAQNGDGRASFSQSSYSRNSYARPNDAGLPPGYRPTPQPAQSASAASLDAEEDEGDESRPGFGSVAAVAPAPSRPAAGPPPRPNAAPAPRASGTRHYAPPVSPWSWSRGEPETAPRRVPTRTASAPPAPPASSARPAAVRTEPAAPRPVEIADARAPAAFPVTLGSTPPPSPPRPDPTPVPEPAARGRLADVAAALDRLEEARRARRAAAAVPSEEARAAPTRTRAAVRRASLAERREPARHWVQLAHAVDPIVLPYEFAKLKAKAPRLLAGRDAWAVTGKSANRLLIGPFGSEAEAQHFVDRLEKSDVTGLAWTSEAGQKVEKLATR